MKKLLFPVVLSAFLIVSCGDDSKDDSSKKGENSSETEVEDDGPDLGEFKTYSLDTFDLDLTMEIPSFSGEMAQVMSPKMEVVDEGAKWKITIGAVDKERFCLFVEDVYGYYQIAEEEGSTIDLIEERKQELEGFSFIQANYVVDEPELIMYEAVYEEGSGVKSHFQVMGIVRKGESIYKVYSDDGITRFNELKARKMIETIKSMQDNGAEA